MPWSLLYWNGGSVTIKSEFESHLPVFHGQTNQKIGKRNFLYVLFSFLCAGHRRTLTINYHLMSIASSKEQDPAAMPILLAASLPVGFFLWGFVTWMRLRPKLTDGSEQIYHGLLMALVAYPLGLLIPHARIKKAMALAHGASLLQAALLIILGQAWHDTFGYVDKSRSSVAAKWINLWGMWGNTFGIVWGAVFGAKELLYVTKFFVEYQAPPWAEAVMHVLLKSQGLCNMVSFVLVMKQFAKKIEMDANELEMDAKKSL
jgi:hypothetical protein